MTSVFGGIKLWVNYFEGNFSEVVGFKSNLDRNGERQGRGSKYSESFQEFFCVRRLHSRVTIEKSLEMFPFKLSYVYCFVKSGDCQSISNIN